MIYYFTIINDNVIFHELHDCKSIVFLSNLRWINKDLFKLYR